MVKRFGGGVVANDNKQLANSLTKKKATPLQRKMAFILLAVNGLENAMEFVAKINGPGQLRLFG